MRRREFIAGLGGSAGILVPIVARAQPVSTPSSGPQLPALGFLSTRSPHDSNAVVSAFRRGLAEAGYAEGTNCTIEFRWANGDYGRLPALAAELVHRPVAVLAAVGGFQSAAAARAATSSLPIVFSIGEDPVERGLVRTLNRPEANITGATFLTSLLGSKRLGLLRELVPGAEPIGLLVNDGTQQGRTQIAEIKDAAQILGIRLVIATASTRQDIETAFADLARRQVAALLVAAEPAFDVQRDPLVALSAQYRMPTLYHIRDFVAAGGLISYGASIRDTYRQVGLYVGRVLNGATPADLPVVRTSNFELAINLQTAKALGLAIPPALLSRADEVVE
jgi:putative ABC transport system substrate-binding protein